MSPLRRYTVKFDGTAPSGRGARTVSARRRETVPAASAAQALWRVARRGGTGHRVVGREQ